MTDKKIQTSISDNIAERDKRNMDNIEELLYNISKNIAYFRQKKKMTQSELAKKVGTSQSNISDYENGKKLGLQQLCLIAEALDVSVTQLIDLDAELLRNPVFPISKFDNVLYYCYYISDDIVKYFQLKTYHSTNSHMAKIKIRFQDNSLWMNGSLVVDDKYAIVAIRIENKNRFHLITFNYYHDSSRDKYIGGLAIYQTSDVNYEDVQLKICAISDRKIDIKQYNVLKNKFLNMDKVVEHCNYKHSIKHFYEQAFFNEYLKKNSVIEN